MSQCRRFLPAIASFYEDPRLDIIAAAISLNFVWTGLTVQQELRFADR